MAEYVTVKEASALKSGERIVVEIKGRYIAIFQVGGTFYAIEDLCSHDDGPVAEGELTGTIIECPRHGAQFDIRTGESLTMVLAPRPVPHFDVRLLDGEVQVLI
ncbi:MAG: non-heme iron oxygenase ferredoxin subunit [Anaerolineae bacterium]|nr:non-heme iron oxygenase ferredoxin subunit [Anaerolineae bacterium]